MTLQMGPTVGQRLVGCACTGHALLWQGQCCPRQGMHSRVKKCEQSSNDFEAAGHDETALRSPARAHKCSFPALSAPMGALSSRRAAALVLLALLLFAWPSTQQLNLLTPSPLEPPGVASPSSTTSPQASCDAMQIRCASTGSQHGSMGGCMTHSLYPLLGVPRVLPRLTLRNATPSASWTSGQPWSSSTWPPEVNTGLPMMGGQTSPPFTTRSTGSAQIRPSTEVQRWMVPLSCSC